MVLKLGCLAMTLLKFQLTLVALLVSGSVDW